MRFLFAVIDHQTGFSTPEESVAIDFFNEKIEADGHRIIAAGLQSPEHSIVVDNRGDHADIIDGPLIDTPEYMSGFWIIDVDSVEHARELAHEASRACNRKIEVRQFLGR